MAVRPRGDGEVSLVGDISTNWRLYGGLLDYRSTLKIFPALTTSSMRSVFRNESSGFAVRTTKSASLPGSIEPMFNFNARPALSVAMRSTAGAGIVGCAGCGVPFKPARRTRQNHGQYCKKCQRAKVPSRRAARAYRERQKRRPISIPEAD